MRTLEELRQSATEWPSGEEFPISRSEVEVLAQLCLDLSPGNHDLKQIARSIRLGWGRFYGHKIVVL